MFGEAENIFEFFRGASLPLIVTVIPMLILMSSPMIVMASQEFTVYRMNHYDFQGAQHGSRNSLFNLETRVAKDITDAFARKCVIIKLNHLLEKLETFEFLVGQNAAAALLILLPPDVEIFSNNENFFQLEKLINDEDVEIPVYFAFENERLLNIYDDIERAFSNENNVQSGTEKLLQTVFANGYQIVVSAPPVASVKDVIISSIQGKLIGSGSEDQMPTIAITSYYDSFGVAPQLSFGSDSNGSGVAAVLELARIFSKLYSNPKTQPNVNLLFFISGGGYYSFLGTKKWIDENLDGAEQGLLSESLFTICLDSLMDREKNNGLFMHVSKPPKEGSPAALFLRDIEEIASKRELNVTLVHKKINLADETLSWEHERFSMRRLPAFTLSALSSAKSLHRKTITDKYDKKLLPNLAKNVQTVAESVFRRLYGLKENDTRLFDEIRVSNQFLATTLSLISSNPRSQINLLSNQRNNNMQLPPFVTTLEQTLNKYLKNVEIFHFKPDRKEPEITFYEPTIATIAAFNTKPAIFDLLVSLSIATYLGLFYLLLTNLHHIQLFLKTMKNNNQNGHATIKYN